MFERTLGMAVIATMVVATGCLGSSAKSADNPDSGDTSDTDTTTKRQDEPIVSGGIGKSGICLIDISSAQVRNETARFFVGLAIENSVVTNAEYRVEGKTFEILASRGDGGERVYEGEWTTISAFKAPVPGDDDLDMLEFRIKITGTDLEVKETKEKGTCKWQ